MHRALPGTTVDTIRDGVPARDLKRRGGKAVWDALVRTAMSATRCGHGPVEWADLITDPRSRLGQQAALRDGRRPRTRLGLQRLLDSAWDQAVAAAVNTSGPAWDAEQIRYVAEQRADHAERRVEQGDGLTDADRAVLTYAIEQTRKRGLLRVALPWRAVRDATGLPERTVKRSLNDLHTHGLLIRVQIGSGSQDSLRRRASLYSLPSAPGERPIDSREATPMGRDGDATPMGRPSQATPMGRSQKETETVQITLTVDQLAALVIAARDAGVEVPLPIPDELPPNVTPIRRRHERGA